MEHRQARILLQKINRLFDAITASDAPPSRIEVDLLHDYTRQFYESLNTRETIEDKPAQPAVAVKVQPPQTVEQMVEPQPERKEVPVESPPSPVAEPVDMPSPVDIPPVTPDTAPAPPPPPPPPLEVPVSYPAQKSPRSEFDVLFTTEEAKDLSDKLRTSPIDDLSRAMGINERFLTINELFHGDHENFDQVLRRLNELPSFETARLYLEEEVIPRYDWLDKTRAKKAGIFIRLIRRRYL